MNGWERCLVICGWVKLALTFSTVSLTVSGQETRPPAEPGSAVKRMTESLDKVTPLLKGKWTQQWATKVGELQPVKPRLVKVGEKEISVDESLYYDGRYGSPLAYARAMDLAEEFGFAPDSGGKIFDFGYGSVGHLQMFAMAGLDVVAVDVDPLLPVMYENASDAMGDGSVKLLSGRFPAETNLVEQAGEGYDLFLSKNTLKRGYIHPAREPLNPRQLIDLGVSDAQYLAAVAKMLKPNGLFVIYNFCPAKAPADKPYIPWADGESPFSKEQLSDAGFDVLAFDIVDDVAARKLAQALGWDAGGRMDLEKDLFAWYTIARRR